MSARLLQASGIDFFLDDLSLPQTGELFDPLPWRLQLALARCGAILIVWSAKASQSYWMQLEITTAVAMIKNVFVLILDNTTNRLPPFLYPGIHKRLIRVNTLNDFTEIVRCGKLLERRVNTRKVNAANRSAKTRDIKIGNTSIKLAKGFTS